MGYGRRKKHEPQLFENAGSNNRKFSAIYLTMMKSEPWKKLTPSAKVLYLTMKMEWKGNGNEIEIPISQLADKSGLSKRTVQRCIVELENSGFINTVTHGGLASGGKISNRYSFSARWFCDSS